MSRLRKLVKPSVTDRIIFINRYLRPGPTRGYKVVMYNKVEIFGGHTPHPRQGVKPPAPSDPNWSLIMHYLYVSFRSEKAISVPFRFTIMPTPPLVSELSSAVPIFFPFTVRVKYLPFTTTLKVLLF